MLGEDRRPLMSTEPVQMIIGSLQVVDANIIEKEGKLDEETRGLSENLVEAILSRDDEFLKMEIE